MFFIFHFKELYLVSFFVGDKTMKEKKEDKVDINCMLHKCKRCPKQRECEEKDKDTKKEK